MSDTRLRYRLKYCLYEAAAFDAGSPGVHFLGHALKEKGVPYDYCITLPFKRYDVYFVSIMHYADYFMASKSFADLDRNDPLPIVIAGGHGYMLNPEPIADLFDVVCIGEGETWICKAVDILEKCAGQSRHKVYDAFLELPGSYLPQVYRPQYNKHERLLKKPDFVVHRQHESDIDKSPIYFNKSNTVNHADTWYKEIARGCEYKCAYCEMGWNAPTRFASKKSVINAIHSVDAKIAPKMNFFTSDATAYPEDYNSLVDEVKRCKMRVMFSSARLSTLRRHPMTSAHKSYLWRMGVDGLSERIRQAVFKPCSNAEIFEFIDKTAPHYFYKLFFVFSFPFEEKQDIMEFKAFIERLMRQRWDRKINIRIKCTAFIPQPGTPLQYASDMEYKHGQFLYRLLGRHEQIPGRSQQRLMIDGITGRISHTMSIVMARGNRNLLRYIRPCRSLEELWNNLKKSDLNWKEWLSYSEDKEYWSYIRTCNSHLLKSAWQKVQHMVGRF